METVFANKGCFNYLVNAEKCTSEKMEVYEEALSKLLNNYEITIEGTEGYLTFQKQEIGETKDFDIRPDKDMLKIIGVEEINGKKTLETKITSSSNSFIGIKIGEFRYHLIKEKTDEYFYFPLK